MAKGVFSAASGAAALTRVLDIVSNNLANANSTGFKAETVSFREVLASNSPDVSQVAIGVTSTDFSPGVTRQTGNPLDVALLGPGFFTVQTANGERYTRAGAFTVTQEGILATQNGMPVLGQAGPISIDPTTPTTIAEDGSVITGGVAQDRLRLVEFEDPQALTREGHALWAADRNQQPQDSEVRLQSGALENSNVNPIAGMTQLVRVTRAYEQFHRAIEIFRDMDQKVARELR